MLPVFVMKVFTSLVFFLWLSSGICHGQERLRGDTSTFLQWQRTNNDKEATMELGLPTKIVEVLTGYWRNDWSILPQEAAETLAATIEGPNSTCTEGWDYLANHSLAVQAIDAFGKLGAGILQGNYYAYGSYDECMSTDHVQYCMVPIYLIYGPDLVLPFRVGMCLPQECTKNDIQHAVNVTDTVLVILEEMGIIRGQFFLYLDTDNVICETERYPPYNAGAIVMIVVCCVFALLVIISSMIDWFLSVDMPEIFRASALRHPFSISSDVKKNNMSIGEKTPLLGMEVAKKRPDNIGLQLITAFSLFKTVPTILSTKQPSSAITSINGIRVLSMFWIILCHTHLWTLIESGLDNVLYVIEHVVPRFSYQVIVNGFFSVDSFFFLSGVLVSYLTLRQMARKKGRFPVIMYYVHRFLRLTPTYAVVLFFYWFLTVHMTDGPNYRVGAGVDSVLYKNCEKYWWTNLLYINNLYPWKGGDECMGWMWYLANDMQFFVVSPLMIVLLYYSLPLGLLSVGIFLVGSFTATGAIAGYYDFNANTILAGIDPTNTTVVSSGDELYIKPYARISPYLVGIVLGYLLYQKVKIPFSKLLNWLIYLAIWGLAAIFCLSTVYGQYGSWHGHTFSQAENVTYFMFSRFTWGLGLALVVFACHNGHGWVVNSFLSMKIWIPLSRLTFNTYLVHEIVLTVIFGNLRDPVHYTDITLAVFGVAAVVLSYGVAGVVAAFVEFPLANIEIIVFKLLGLGGRESARQVTEVKEVHVDTEQVARAELRPSPPPNA